MNSEVTNRIALALLLPLIALMATSDAYGQRCAGGGCGWGPRGDYARRYDVESVETIKGEVVSVERFTPGSGMSQGVHLKVRTESGALSVHLGPAWFIENQDESFEAGDEIEVTGSRMTFQGEPALIAAMVKKGEAVLQLRDERGYPAWSGWRHGPGHHNNCCRRMR